MAQITKEDFRYAIEERPKHIFGDTDATHMVVDQRKKVAVFFGDHDDCQDWLQRLLQR